MIKIIPINKTSEKKTSEKRKVKKFEMTAKPFSDEQKKETLLTMITIHEL